MNAYAHPASSSLIFFVDKVSCYNLTLHRFLGSEDIDHYQKCHANRQDGNKSKRQNKGGNHRQNHRGDYHIKSNIEYCFCDLEGNKKEKIEKDQIKGELTPKTQMRIEKKIGLLDPLDWQGKNFKY